MRDKLLSLYVQGRTRLIKAMETFAEDERGASHMVEIIVVIVIVIALAGVFRTRLQTAVETILDNLDTFIGV